MPNYKDRPPLSYYRTALPGVDYSELQGKLIVVEGPDAVGRSTQIRGLKPWLEELGHAVLDTGMARSALAGKGIKEAKQGNTLGPVTMTMYYLTDFADRLENEIIPAYYERGADGLPHRWLALMKEAIRTCAPAFSMRRMVKEYTTRFYVPEIQQTRQAEQKHFEKARILANWKNKVIQAWPALELYADGRRDGQLSLGEGINVLAWVKVQKLTPEDLNVELVYGEEQGEQITTPEKLSMRYIRQEQDGSYRYELRLQPDTSGSMRLIYRERPQCLAIWRNLGASA